MKLIERLESRRLLAFALNVNFQPAGSPVPAGYVADVGLAYADRGNGFTYGWDGANTGGLRDRNLNADQRYDTLNHTQAYGTHKWELAVPNGQYQVHLVAGDAAYINSIYKINVEGVLTVDGTPTSSNHFVEGTKTVTVSDGRLTISNASGGNNNKVCFIDITQVSPPPPPPPPSGATIPGQIEAENFDDGGKNISWFDTTAGNAGGVYRTNTDVDVQTNSGGGYAIGSTRPTEWTKYTFTAASTANYAVDIRVASATGGTFHLEFDGVDKTGPLTLPNTGGWQVWKTISKSGISLAAGEHTMRLVFDKRAISGQDIGNVDSFKFSTVVVPPPPTDGNTITWRTGNASIARSEAMTATVDGKMYVFGGYLDSTFAPTNRVDVYDPVADTWTRLSDSDMPVATSHSGCTVIGRNVIIAGGYPRGTGGVNQTFSTTGVWSWNVDTHVWTTLPSLPAARGGGALVNLGGVLHYFGGADSSRHDANTHWYLYPNSTEWKPLAPLPTTRNHMGAVVLDNKIYAIGGQQNQDAAEIPQAAVEVYDPATHAWSAAASLPFGRSHIAGATVVMNGRIVVLGGETNYNVVVGDVVAYDPLANHWAAMTNLPATRNSGVAAFVNGELIYSEGRFATTTYRGVVS